VTFGGAEFIVLSFLSQIAVATLNAVESRSYQRNIDMDEVMLTHADVDPGGRRPGLAFTPQGVCAAPTRRSAPSFRLRARRRCRGRSSPSVSIGTGR
jgi:hypothetical protein